MVLITIYSIPNKWKMLQVFYRLCNTCPSDICPHLFWDICPHYFGTFTPTYFGHLPLGHLLPHILGHLHPPIIKSESVGFLRQVANPPPSSHFGNKVNEVVDEVLDEDMAKELNKEMV